MMPVRDSDGIRDIDRGRDRDRNGASRAPGGEREEVVRGTWDRDRGRDRGGETNRGRGRERESSRDRGRGRESSRDIDRDRCVVSRASGGEREQMSRSPVDRYRRNNDNEATDLRRKEFHDDDERRPIGRARCRGYDDDERRPTSRDRDRGYDDDKRRPMSRDRGRGYDDDERRPIGRDRGRGYDDDDDERRPMGRGRGGMGRGGRGRRGDSDKPAAPPLYSIHKARVHSIRSFGIFVEMEGYRNHGLVHLSQVSDHEVTNRDDSEEAKMKALSSVAGEGDQVWIKVVSVQVEEDGKTKIGCSMKYVSQGDGQDLDPNNIQAEKQQSRPSWKEPQKFKLEAVYNVQCERCGGHGHLKKECYSSGEKTYKLLSDDEEADLTAQKVTRGEERLPRESSKHMQPPKPLSGVSTHLLATGSVGRGRAVVQPAWMKHGIGVGGSAPSVVDAKENQDLALPKKVTTLEEAEAVIAHLKEEKKRRKEEKKDKRHRSRDEKKGKHEKKDKHKKRHRDEDDHKERHGSRKKRRDASEDESDDDDHKERKKHREEDDYRKSKKHRDEEESDEDGHKERKKHRDKDDYKKSKKHRDLEDSDESDYKKSKKHRDLEDSDEGDHKKSKKHRDKEVSDEDELKNHGDENSRERHSVHKKHRDEEDYEERQRSHRKHRE